MKKFSMIKNDKSASHRNKTKSHSKEGMSWKSNELTQIQAQMDT